MTESIANFSEDEVEQMLNNLDSFTDEEIVEINRIVDELEVRRNNKAAYDDLIEFWSSQIYGIHSATKKMTFLAIFA